MFIVQPKKSPFKKLFSIVFFAIIGLFFIFYILFSCVRFISTAKLTMVKRLVRRPSIKSLQVSLRKDNFENDITENGNFSQDSHEPIRKKRRFISSDQQRPGLSVKDINMLFDLHFKKRVIDYDSKKNNSLIQKPKNKSIEQKESVMTPKIKKATTKKKIAKKLQKVVKNPEQIINKKNKIAPSIAKQSPVLEIPLKNDKKVPEGSLLEQKASSYHTTEISQKVLSQKKTSSYNGSQKQITADNSRAAGVDIKQNNDQDNAIEQEDNIHYSYNNYSSYHDKSNKNSDENNDIIASKDSYSVKNDDITIFNGTYNDYGYPKDPSAVDAADCKTDSTCLDYVDRIYKGISRFPGKKIAIIIEFFSSCGKANDIIITAKSNKQIISHAFKAHVISLLARLDVPYVLQGKKVKLTI